MYSSDHHVMEIYLWKYQQHVLLECEIYKDLREKYFEKVSEAHPTFD